MLNVEQLKCLPRHATTAICTQPSISVLFCSQVVLINLEMHFLVLFFLVHLRTESVCNTLEMTVLICQVFWKKDRLNGQNKDDD